MNLKKAQSKVTLKLLILFIVMDVVSITVMRMAAGHISSLTQGILKILDLRQMYSVEDAYLLFDSIGKEGRLFYVDVFQLIDLIYPVIYTSMYTIILTLLISAVPLKQKKLKYLVFLPVISFIFDISENIFIRIMIKNYSTRLPILAKLASYATFLKWLSMAVLVIVILMLLIRFSLYLYKRGKV